MGGLNFGASTIAPSNATARCRLGEAMRKLPIWPPSICERGLRRHLHAIGGPELHANASAKCTALLVRRSPPSYELGGHTLHHAQVDTSVAITPPTPSTRRRRPQCARCCGGQPSTPRRELLAGVRPSSAAGGLSSRTDNTRGARSGQPGPPSRARVVLPNAHGDAHGDVRSMRVAVAGACGGARSRGRGGMRRTEACAAAYAAEIVISTNENAIAQRLSNARHHWCTSDRVGGGRASNRGACARKRPSSMPSARRRVPELLRARKKSRASVRRRHRPCSSRAPKTEPPPPPAAIGHHRPPRPRAGWPRSRAPCRPCVRRAFAPLLHRSGRPRWNDMETLVSAARPDLSAIHACLAGIRSAREHPHPAPLPPHRTVRMSRISRRPRELTSSTRVRTSSLERHPSPSATLPISPHNPTALPIARHHTNHTCARVRNAHLSHAPPTSRSIIRRAGTDDRLPRSTPASPAVLRTRGVGGRALCARSALPRANTHAHSRRTPASTTAPTRSAPARRLKPRCGRVHKPTLRIHIATPLLHSLSPSARAKV